MDGTQRISQNFEIDQNQSTTYPKNKFRYWLVSLLFVIFIVCSASIAYLIGKQSGDTSNSATSNNPVVVPNGFSMFTKRPINESKRFIEDQPYPAFITAMNDQSLKSISCTQKYIPDYENQSGFISVKETDKMLLYFPLSDPDLQSRIKQISDAYPNDTYPNMEILDIRKCITQTNNEILMYNLNTGKSLESKIYVSYLNSDEVFELQKARPIFYSHNGACNILQLTTNGELFIECGRGDGGFQSSAIYRYDTNTNKAWLDYECLLTSETESVLMYQTSKTLDCSYPNQEINI